MFNKLGCKLKSFLVAVDNMPQMLMDGISGTDVHY